LTGEGELQERRELQVYKPCNLSTSLPYVTQPLQAAAAWEDGQRLWCGKWKLPGGS